MTLEEEAREAFVALGGWDGIERRKAQRRQVDMPVIRGEFVRVRPGSGSRRERRDVIGIPVSVPPAALAGTRSQ